MFLNTEILMLSVPVVKPGFLGVFGPLECQRLDNTPQ
jgi:hypothetical protein